MSDINPSAATMIERTRGVGMMVDYIIPRIRSTSGSYAELMYRVYQRYYPELVKVSYNKETGAFHIHYYKFDNIFLVAAPDTIRRRAQERFHYEREKIWQKVAVELNQYNFEDEEWRQTDEAQDKFKQLAKGNKYLPSWATQKKRELLEQEYHKEFGIRQRQMML